MIVRVEKLERGVRETRGGQTQDGLWLRGVKLDQFGEDEKPYERFLTQQFDQEFITILENMGTDIDVNLSFVKKGQFWNLQSVTEDKPAHGGDGSKPTQSTTTTYNSAPKSVAAAPVVPAPVVANTQVKALEAASKVVGQALALQASDMAIKLFPKKITLDLLTVSVLTMAEKFEDYLDSVPEKEEEEDTPTTTDTALDSDVPEGDIPF